MRDPGGQKTTGHASSEDAGKVAVAIKINVAVEAEGAGEIDEEVTVANDDSERADLGQRMHPGRSAASADITTTAAALSFFRRNWWPHGTVLGEVPEMGGWYGTAKYPGATQLPGVVVFRRKRRSSSPTVVSSGIRSGGWHANGPCLDRSALPGGH